MFKNYIVEKQIRTLSATLDSLACKDIKPTMFSAICVDLLLPAKNIQLRLYRSHISGLSISTISDFPDFNQELKTI